MTDTNTVATLLPTEINCANIRAFEKAKLAERQAAGSGKTDTAGSKAVAGLTLARQAREANKRETLLKQELSKALVSSYSAMMQRYNKLQNTAGVINTMLRSSPYKVLQGNEYFAQTSEKSDPRHAGEKAKFVELLPNIVENQSTVSNLGIALAKISEFTNNSEVRVKAGDLINRIDDLRNRAFSEKALSLLNTDSIYLYKEGSGYRHAAFAYANPVACAGVKPESLEGSIKNMLGNIIKESYSLLNSVKVLNKTTNSEDLKQATLELEGFVVNILCSSDKVLLAEYQELCP